jgi:predicted Zn-dependent protease
MFIRWVAVGLILLAVAALQPARALDLDEVEALTHREFDRRLSAYVDSDHLIVDPGLNRLLDAVFLRLLAAAFDQYPDAMHFRWELQLVRDDTVSAESCSDGRILVSRAFVERYVGDESQLAFILGHEIGHALARHVRSYYARAAAKAQAVGLTPAILVESVRTDTALEISLNRLAREQELEADAVGVALARRAGFRASGAEEVLQDFMRAGDDFHAAWTHDSAALRLETLRRGGLLGRPLAQGG